MTNWNERDMTIDFSFLGNGNYEAEIFRDGINADRDATDYKKEKLKVDALQKLKIHLAPGGGFAMRIVEVVKNNATENYFRIDLRRLSKNTIEIIISNYQNAEL